MQDEHLSAIHVVCNNDAAGPLMLCPDGALDFLPDPLPCACARFPPAWS